MPRTAIPAIPPRSRLRGSLGGVAAPLVLTAGALAALLPGCAAQQLAISERETSEIIDGLGTKVAEEREAAKKASTARAVPETPPETLPKVVGLADALRVAGRRNRDLLREREGLVLSALSLRNAENAIGPRLFGTIGYTLAGRDDADETLGGTGSLGATAILPTGAEATLTTQAGKSYGRGDGTNSDADASVTARISQPLLSGAGYEASHEALTDAQRQALYDVRQFELSRQDLALEVQDSYYGLVSQRQVIRNRELTLKNFEFLKKRSERLFEVGQVSEVDKFRAAREYLTAENGLVDAREEYDSRLDRFKILLGLETTVPLDIAEEIPEPRKVDTELRRAMDTAIANRLELMTARDQVADAERRERIRARELLPDLNLELSGTRASSAGSIRGTSPLERDSYGVGVALEIPLDRVRERGAHRSAKIDVSRARRELTLTEDRVLLDVREAMRSLRSSESSLVIQEQIVASEEKNVKIAQLRFERGEIGNRDLTDALTNLADAKDRYIREKANAETARLRLLRSLGLLRMNADGTWQE